MVCGVEALHPSTIETIQHEDGEFVILRCKNCQHDLKKRKPQLPTKVTDKTGCRKCGAKVELRKARHKGSKHLQKAYYFTHYYKCVTCYTMYMDDKFKVINKK